MNLTYLRRLTRSTFDNPIIPANIQPRDKPPRKRYFAFIKQIIYQEPKINKKYIKIYKISILGFENKIHFKKVKHHLTVIRLLCRKASACTKTC